jgi:hypothetical protein
MWLDGNTGSRQAVLVLVCMCEVCRAMDIQYGCMHGGIIQSAIRYDQARSVVRARQVAMRLFAVRSCYEVAEIASFS